MRLDSLPDGLPNIAEPKQVEIDSSDSVLTRADLAWSISGWRMTDELFMLKGGQGLYFWSGFYRIGCLSDELRGSLVKGAQVIFMINWFSVQVSTDVGLEVTPVRDENLFEVELRNDLMDSPPAVGWESDGN
ncbi:hypothetical protein PPACK8108_LOCUS16599 [Phakopsora pachyrhizi]|uniref:Uncharacterized protein n=1 Tax=Phakopsora pachyrhizi TaxID=170000 RepID=A0AAV0BBQ7_PHAPC|nr:hypothetical protein PPACK8108_LOCUS16599 [Phakopsora pachyrhizi]